jgi:group I intron endonuclease
MENKIAKNLLKKSGVYIIRNLLHSKVYVGSAVNFKIRIDAHRRKLLSNKHHCKPLQYFVNKHGIDKLYVELLELCEESQLLVVEQQWLDFYKSYNSKNGFNVCKVAGRTTGLTFVMAEETKKKLSIAHKGRVKSEETRRKLSEAHKGKIVSEETRKKLSIAVKGRKHSEETKKRITQLNLNCPNKEDRYKRTGDKLRGRKDSEDVCIKKKEAAKKRGISKETQEKMAAGRREFWKRKRANLLADSLTQGLD